MIEISAGTRGFNSFGFSSIRQWIFSGAYQIQKPLKLGDIKGIDYYYGGGLAVSFWTFGDGFGDEFNTTSIGAQGYLGLSYVFEDLPLNITLDWVPTIFFGNNAFRSGFATFGSLGVRYVLSR